MKQQKRIISKKIKFSKAMTLKEVIIWPVPLILESEPKTFHKWAYEPDKVAHIEKNFKFPKGSKIFRFQK